MKKERAGGLGCNGMHSLPINFLPLLKKSFTLS